jgi:O-antigen/teichoic acid export membrane protein
MAGLIVPAVAVAASRSGIGGARRMAVRYGALGAVMLLPYYALILVVPELVIRIFTKHNPAYAGLATPLRLFVLAYVVVLPGQVLRSLLEGLGRTRAAFVAQAAFSATTLLISLPLAARFGLTGAVWAGVFPAAAYVAVSSLMLRRVGAEMSAPGFEVVRPSASPNGKPLTAGALVAEPEGAVA